MPLAFGGDAWNANQSPEASVRDTPPPPPSATMCVVRQRSSARASTANTRCHTGGGASLRGLSSTLPQRRSLTSINRRSLTKRQPSLTVDVPVAEVVVGSVTHAQFCGSECPGHWNWWA